MWLIVEQLPIRVDGEMLPSRSIILSEAKSKLTKTFSVVFFLNLHYTFLTYDGPKSNEQRTKSNKQRAKSNKQRAKSNEQQVKSNEQRAKSNKQRIASNKFHLKIIRQN